MSKHILGIRHHGPGSARAVADFLERLQPDIVLVEGPPEGDALLAWVAREGMRPPVAMLVYNPDAPRQASFYPFAVFSPEWQAFCYAHKAAVPVRFMDLPAAHALPFRTADVAPPDTGPGDGNDGPDRAVEVEQPVVPGSNPLGQLAQAAGWDDAGSWWEYMFENRRSSEDSFEAVSEAMSALREQATVSTEHFDLVREAWMRKVIRQAEREMFTNIAVICGAWHVPGLNATPKLKDDNELLKGLRKVKIETTWVPWTYDRPSYFSGYGAGIWSPGWYHHLWEHPHDDGTRWMSQVAGLFRSKGMDTSVAHVIESVRLAAALASLRGHPKPGLHEMNEAVKSVMCAGDETTMQLIREALIVSNRIGTVPEDVPQPPLQADIERNAKTLRLARTADYKDYALDLRKEFDLQRSVFLHRLSLLGIDWGAPLEAGGKGTFRESWRLQWSPELAIAIIEKGSWGNTLEAAAVSFVVAQMKGGRSLTAVAALLEHVLPAALPEAAALLSAHLANMAAASSDVLELVKIIPGLAQIIRYGNVRKTDSDMVLGMLDSIVTRVCIGLPAAAVGLNEDTAAALTAECAQVQESINLLQDESFKTRWQQCLQQLSGNEATAPVIRGFALRQLMDYDILAPGEGYNLFSRACSPALPAASVASWLEGFLIGSGTVLLLDDTLWTLVDDWIATLSEEQFPNVLPLLRRTFSTFSPAERRKLGEKAKGGTAGLRPVQADTDIDHERGLRALTSVLQLLGLPAPTHHLSDNTPSPFKS